MDVNNIVERTVLTPRHGWVPRLGAFAEYLHLSPSLQDVGE